MSLSVKEKRERSHSYLYTSKQPHNKRKKNKIFSVAVRLNVLEMKLDSDAHEKKEMKQTNRKLFIGNNDNKDRKKNKTSLCIYCKKIIRKKNIHTWFYSKSILAVSSSLKSLNTSSSDSFLFV